jgi:transcriptional regulator with XRE-family HTH domain
VSDQPIPASAPSVSVRIGADSHTIEPGQGAVVLGRDPLAAIRVNDDRISRAHIRLEPQAGGWQAIDTSTNGMFIDGVRRSSVAITGPTTIHLGNPEGIPVTLTLTDPAEVTEIASLADVDSEPWTETEETDPDIVRAGRAVAARRRELDITQRSLARDKIINAGALIAFEKGRSWPRRATLAKLEEVLQWPAGTITRIRNGAAPVHDSEATDVITNTVQAPLMAEAVELAMHTIGSSIAALPKPSDPDFTPRATAILGDLRKLESVAASAARSAKGTPSVALALSAVRRRYNDVMLRAARSPSATLGQRLYGARHRAELSAEETANAAGLPLDVIVAVESERPIPPDAVAAVENLIAQLSVT